MPTIANTPSFGVLRNFQDFYVQIVELKREAHSPPLLPPPAGVIEAQTEGGLAAEIWHKVTAILDRQSLDTMHLGSVAAGVHREARFVMVALADEFFVHPRWEGTDYWLTHLLETRYFHTQSAGDFFFSKLSALLSSQESSTDELAALYLTALGLGFRGKYFGDPNGDAELKRLRVRLYELIKYRNPRLLDEGGYLFPDTYLSTLDKGVPRRLPDPSRWIALAVGVVLFWFVVSFMLWRALSDDLRSALPERQTGYQQTAAPAKTTSAPATTTDVPAKTP